MKDEYGLNREALIKASGVRDIFTPNMPITGEALFTGRKSFTKSVIEGINTPGQHLLLYGDRGVGKSSLANFTVSILKRAELLNGHLIIKRCSHDDTFKTLTEFLLEHIDENNNLIEKSTSEKGTESIGGKVFGVGGEIKNEDVTTKKYKILEKLSPSNLADYLQNREGMFLVDEFDTLKDEDDKVKMAELIKLLSDYSSKFKIFIVGIAESGTELTSGHPSVNRCLKEIKLEKMTDNEIKEIITTGLKKLHLDISDQVLNMIINIANGYPHFAHLMGLKSSEEAIVNSVKKITKKEFVASIDKAVNDSKGTMKRLYDNATQNLSLKKSTNIKFILKACSTTNHEAFTLTDINTKLRIDGIDLTNRTISDYISKFTGNNGDILRRIKRGVYCFNDPRMQSYIKMIENKLIRDEKKLPYGEV